MRKLTTHFKFPLSSFFFFPTPLLNVAAHVHSLNCELPLPIGRGFRRSGGFSPILHSEPGFNARTSSSATLLKAVRGGSQLPHPLPLVKAWATSLTNKAGVFKPNRHPHPFRWGLLAEVKINSLSVQVPHFQSQDYLFRAIINDVSY